MHGSQYKLDVVDYFSPLIVVAAFLAGIAFFTLTVVKFIYSKNETTKLNHSFTSFRGRALTEHA